MTSEKKTKATRYQEEHRIERSKRPVYHVTPPTGWMNDPNGFSIYKGKIHLFYQYHPYRDVWGPMHWGHCTSDDYLEWQDEPVALAPDEYYDASGCFSGSALQVGDDHVILYTGAAKRRPGESTRLAHQQQCLAVGNGIDYVKYEHNPVITTKMLPAEYKANEFRDPKVWKRDGMYYMVTAAMDQSGRGNILMYRSEDLKQWRFLSVLIANDGSYGDMWECPDFFVLGGDDVLIVSCMFMKDNGPGYHDGWGTIVCLGQLNRLTYKLEATRVYPLDQGADFYAPQTLVTDDGRRIMIAWMQAWENFIKPVAQKWHGMMTIPRELELRDGKIFQHPVRELEKARTNPVKLENVRVTGMEEEKLQGISGRVLELQLDITSADCEELTISFAEGSDSGIHFTWLPAENVITCERMLWGISTEDVTDAYRRQTIHLPENAMPLRLHFLLDTASVELFINDGETTFSSTVYAPEGAQDIRFSCRGYAVMDVEKYDIDPRLARAAATERNE